MLLNGESFTTKMIAFKNNKHCLLDLLITTILSFIASKMVYHLKAILSHLSFFQHPPNIKVKQVGGRKTNHMVHPFQIVAIVSKAEASSLLFPEKSVTNPET